MMVMMLMEVMVLMSLGQRDTKGRLKAVKRLPVLSWLCLEASVCMGQGRILYRGVKLPAVGATREALGGSKESLGRMAPRSRVPAMQPAGLSLSSGPITHGSASHGVNNTEVLR